MLVYIFIVNLINIVFSVIYSFIFTLPRIGTSIFIWSISVNSIDTSKQDNRNKYWFAYIIFLIIVCSNIKTIDYSLGKLTGKLMNEKDKRVKLMSEIIRGVRVIKFYVWEKYFLAKVDSMLIFFLY